MEVQKIGKFIAENRKLKGLTQEQLGEKLGVTNKTISRWETGKYMPDLSLLKPISIELGITLNELLNGEKIEKDNIMEVTEKSLVNTIDYTKKKIDNQNIKISISLIIIGIIISLASFTIFNPESSWCSIYSIIGVMIFIIGLFKELKTKKLWIKITISALIFIVIMLLFFIIDYVGVVTNKRPPIFRYMTETKDIITYYNPFYKVYRINANTKNQYFIVDTKNEYNIDTLPKSPFNREKCGIDNIIKFKNKYVGNNSNIGALINKLPLAEYGYIFEIDTNNLGLIIDYHITDWYIQEELYLQKSLIYNTVSIFTLIENVEYIEYNFTGNSYKITRKMLEENYPNYFKIMNNNIDKENFNRYLENEMNNTEFVQKIYDKIFNK